MKNGFINAGRKATAKGLNFIQSNPFLGSMFTEVVGCNIPKVLMVGSKPERHEQFIMQFLNTTVIWGGGFLYDKALNKLIYESSPYFQNMLKGIGAGEQQIKNAKDWHTIGKTAGLFGLVVPWMFTLPFLRSAFTVYSTGATNFAQMTGMQSYDRNDPKHQAEEQKALRKDLGIFIGSNASLLTLGLLGAYAGRIGMEKSIKGEKVPAALEQFQKGVHWFDESFRKIPFIGSKDPKASVLFKNGSFTQFDGLPLVVSWVIPGYAGYLAAIRDPVEAFEQIGNSIIALVSFEAGPKWFRDKFEARMTRNPTHPLVQGAVNNLGSVSNAGQLLKMLLSTSLYGMLPTALNLVSRPLRAQMVGMRDAPLKEPIPMQPDATEPLTPSPPPKAPLRPAVSLQGKESLYTGVAHQVQLHSALAGLSL